MPPPSHRVWDHPRGCGEHLCGSWSRSWCSGSSPRMRGARPRMSSGRTCTRIIPADAGSTQLRYAFLDDNGDHPRGCGEHLREIGQETVEQGSSPRMRGALITGSFLRDDCRIIPADAGSTYDMADDGKYGEDHPRGCGEHVTALAATILYRGSSPRMRGAHGRA